MTPGKVLLMMMVLTALALAMVWQSAAIRETGYDLARLHAEMAEQQAELAMHRAHISKLKNPQRILSLVEWLGLTLEERPVAHVAMEDRPDASAEEMRDASVAELPRL